MKLSDGYVFVTMVVGQSVTVSVAPVFSRPLARDALAKTAEPALGVLTYGKDETGAWETPVNFLIHQWPGPVLEAAVEVFYGAQNRGHIAAAKLFE